MSGRLPNFLYIGTSKAGSTWIFDVLSRHPDVYMAPGKSLHFFSSHYARGLDWYRARFAGAGDERVVGEVSHTYLYDEAACERIAAIGDDVRLMVCLREPVERAFSDYLDAVKNERFRGTFEDALAEEPEFLDVGLYARHLAPFVARFGPERLHVAIFDDLVRDPDAFAGEVFRFLDLEPIPLSSAQREKMMPAALPRSVTAARLAKLGSRALKLLGQRGLRGRLKTSRALRSALYRPYAATQQPSLHSATRARLREGLRTDMKALDALLGTRLCERWGYDG